MPEITTFDEPDLSYARPSLRVVEAVAAADGVDPADLEPPLHAVVDSVALDRLFDATGDETPSRRGRVRFQYRGYDVTVHSSGRVELAPPNVG